MNFLGIVTRLVQESGASGAGPTTTVNQVGEYGRMVNWVQDAWLDIQSEHQDWEFLRTTCSFPTVSGSPFYTPAQANATNFGMWDLDTFRNYANPTATMTIASPCVVTLSLHGLNVGDTVTFFTTGGLPTGITSGIQYFVSSVLDINDFTLSATVGGALIVTTGTQSGTQTITSNNTLSFVGMRSEVLMFKDHYDVWRDSYLYGNLRFTTARPLNIAMSPAKALCLGPIPADGYSVLGDYFQAPSYFANDTSIPSVPLQYQMRIVYKALIRYGCFEEDEAVIKRATNMDGMFSTKMAIDLLPEITIGGALA